MYTKNFYTKFAQQQQQQQQQSWTMSSSVEYSSSVSKLVLVSVAMYLIWMDVALYMNLQQLPPLNQRPNRIQSTGALPFSPFSHTISIKLVMMSPPMHYIDLPLAMCIEDAFTISNYFTANAVSIIGLCFGLIAARLFISKKWHFLAFFINRIRDVADSLDGFVARARAKEHIRAVNPEFGGYVMDGVCDGIAQSSIILATGFCLLSQVNRHGFLHLCPI